MAAAARKFASLMAEVDSDDDKPPQKDDTTEAAERKVEEVTEKVSQIDVKANDQPPDAEKDEEEEEEDKPMGKFKYADNKGGKKQSRQQKRKANKADAEKKRREQAEKEMESFVDPKIAEDQMIADQLQHHKLKVKDIKSDGHCMYRAIADQIIQQKSNLTDALFDEVKDWFEGAEYMRVRKKAAEFMRSHRMDFEPFIDPSGLDGADPYSAYVDRLENTAEWGGDVELTALAKALPANIHVNSAGMPEQTFSPEIPAGLHLRLTFHRHAFGLGEHYNSVQPANF